MKTNYILKNTNDKKEILLYQEKVGYSFTPKKGYQVNKITILNEEMVNSILREKLSKKYKKLMKMVLDILNGSDATDGDINVALNEINNLKTIMINKYGKYLAKDLISKYLKRMDILEYELRKRLKPKVKQVEQNFMFSPFMPYEDNIEEEKGKGR